MFDIAQVLAITVGGTSQAVDGLEKSGLCVRAPHPADRRSSIVELTPVARATPVFDAELQRPLQVSLTKPGAATLADSLRTLRRSIVDGVEGTAAPTD